MPRPAPVWVCLTVIALFAGAAVAEAAETAAGPRPPAALRCEYLENPMGVDTPAPRFFWVLEHSGRGQRQTAFRVQVATDPAFASADMWDSGKVASPQSTQVAYAGKPLASGRSYTWRVKSWDKDGLESGWSEPASFDTGLLRPEDWTGRWIRTRGLARKEFSLPGKPVRARAYVCGLGYSELHLNGRKVGGSVLDPAWTTYDKRALYVAHDVTRYLREGANAAGVMLGQGWYKSRALLLQLRVELEGGRAFDLASDGTWRTADGPVVSDGIYDGEAYDARLEAPGWASPGFDDAAWEKAEEFAGPGGVLSAQLMPPIRVMDTIVPLTMANPRPGVFIFDMGQNFSGWARLRVRGPRGAEVRLRFAELLAEDGTLNVDTVRGARAEDRYILKGEGEEVWEPRFTYHGFRYVAVTGFPGVPTAETLRGRVVRTAVRQAGSFACSKPVLNQLQRIIVWGQATNLHSIPTDCCQRDERMGWLGDAQGTAEEAIYNFDMAAFYTNFLRDIRDVQDDKGTITDTVPHVWGSRPADPAWGTAYPLIAWYMYRYYGDRRVLEEHYDGVRAYVEFLRSQAPGGILKLSHYGDWVAVEKCPGPIVSTFYYYYDIKVLADMARVLGKAAEAAACDRLAAEVRTAFHKEFFDPRTGDYADGTQTANTLALFLDLAPEATRGRTWGRLFDDVVYRHDSHLTTGIIGTKYIMELLTRSGVADLAYDLATRTDYPSWGYMIRNGATTLWELWQKREGPSMNSHNHPMFGSVGSWLYKALGGIELAEGANGFEKIQIQPRMVRDLRYAAASTATVRGDVACAWSRGDQSIRIEVTVPVGSEAEVRLPRFNLRGVVIKEGGVPVWQGDAFVAGPAGVSGIKAVEGGFAITVGSGRYVFDLSGD